MAQNKAYALYKPAAWMVTEEPGKEDLRILVRSPDAGSTVDFFFARNGTGRADAVELLARFRQRLMANCPDLAISEAFVSRDGSKALATVRCRAGAGFVKGRYYFEASPAGMSAQGYRAPETELNAQRPLLMNIMASLAFPKAQQAPAAVEPVRVTLVPRQAQDGSMSIRIPADWAFLAAGGKVLTGSPDGSLGFIFTSISGNPMVPNATIAQGIIPTSYKPPPEALRLFLQAFGHSNIQIVSGTPDTQTMQECAGLGKRCDAQDIVARWTSSKGAQALGAIKIINSMPSPATGIWYFIVSGIWGPERDFARYCPLLAEVGGSYAINDQYVRRYVQQGLENLRRLQAKTAAAMQDLNRAREQNQAAWEARQERKD